MIKLIIFDLDGTLLDTSGDICSVLNCSLKKFGLPELSLEKTMEYVGNGARRLIERAVGDNRGLIEKVYNDFTENFAACDNSLTKLYPNEAEILEYFIGKRIKLAIVTNKPQKAAAGVYTQYLARFGFFKLYGQTDAFPLKPNPASTLSIIDEFGLKKEECLFVGDGETDVETARAAGISCISVLWGFRTEKQLKEAGAELFAHSFEELKNIVLKS